MTTLARAATVLVALAVATACRAQSPAAGAAEMDAMDSTDQHATHAAPEAMSGPLSMDPHLMLTPLRPRSAGGVEHEHMHQ